MEEALDGGVGKDMDRSVNTGRLGASLARRGMVAGGGLKLVVEGADWAWRC